MKEKVKKIDLWSIFIYFIFYSLIGFILETLFGVVTKGVVESRKSFLYGPFCSIYGIGAIAMILFLRNEKNRTKIFFEGAIIGAFVEYAMSFFCERFLKVKWWDYSDYLLNVQGRTCLFFAFLWGILAILLIKHVNPRVDNFIDILKQKKNFFKIVTLTLMAFFVVDSVITSYAIRMFYYRISAENNLNVENSIEIKDKYAQIQESNNLLGFINNYYDNEKMIKTYPNIIISEKNQNNVYVENLLRGVKSYYYQLGEAFK